MSQIGCGETCFSMADLYPNMQGLETSNMVTPDENDQDALGADYEAADKANPNNTPKSKIFLAVLMIVLLIVFLGGGK